MDKRQIYISTIVILSLSVVILFWVFWKKENNDHNLILYGNIDIRQADLGFRVFGRLKTLHVEEGDKVSKGDLLAELDSEPYIHKVQEAEAKVAALEENLSYATLQMERRSILITGKSISQEDYQQSYFNQKVLQANFNQAEASLKNAKIELEDTKLICPSDGVVYTRIREPGTVLDKGQPVYSLAVNTPIWARTYISETHLGNISPGMQVKIYTDTKQNPIYNGHIGYISPIAEFTPKNVETPDLRTNLVYQVRVVIDNPYKGLRQGMPVTIRIPVK